MPRVNYIEKAAASPEMQKLYDGFESQFGLAVPNVVKALANSPGLAAKVFPLANYFMNQSALDKRVRELAVLMLMKRCNCEYGFVRHIDIAKRCGLSQEQIDDVGNYKTSARFTSDDKVILRYAEELTLNARVDDELFAAAEKIVGNKANMIDLTGAIAFWNMMARNLNALQVTLEK
ncbi:MAG TPA: carboxymuconolactone decarboxylase family protein [Candidatus Binataceae bacterium]|nr:carboxymuconolactone decarboxylase family protein [Candidatus Binataceae bacterium]